MDPLTPPEQVRFLLETSSSPLSFFFFPFFSLSLSSSIPLPLPQLEAWQQDMSRRNANWELQVYGKAMHAFMRPDKLGEEHRSVGFQSDPDVAVTAFRRAVSFVTNSLERSRE